MAVMTMPGARWKISRSSSRRMLLYRDLAGPTEGLVVVEIEPPLAQMKTVILLLRLTTLLLVSCIALSRAAGGQSQPPAPSELVIRATTRMVAVDLAVEDHDRAPVTTLNKNHFTIPPGAHAP